MYVNTLNVYTCVCLALYLIMGMSQIFKKRMFLRWQYMATKRIQYTAAAEQNSAKWSNGAIFPMFMFGYIFSHSFFLYLGRFVLRSLFFCERCPDRFMCCVHYYYRSTRNNNDAELVQKQSLTMPSVLVLARWLKAAKHKIFDLFSASAS